MNLRIKQYNSVSNPYGLPKFDMNIWVTSSDAAALGVVNPSAPVYVTLKCSDILNRFAFHAKLSIFNPKVEMESGYVWIAKELLPQLAVIEKDTEVEISLIPSEKMIEATAVSVALPPDKVKTWAEDEERHALNVFRSEYRMSFPGQKAFIKPGMKDVVTGEVRCIYPKGKKGDIYRITPETRITLEGLPDDRQKVIDFSKIGGLDDVITRLREIIQIPIVYPEQMKELGIKPPKGMLLYGPPGNGKTMIARAVAHSMGSSFISINLTELLSKYVGNGEKKLEEKFAEAESKGNCVIFIDEIDSIASARTDSTPEHHNQMIGTLLSLMDGLNSTSKVFVVGATNRLNVIDPALRRPGRFDLEFEVPLPDRAARLDILTKYVNLDNTGIYEPDVTLSLLGRIADLTNGFSGADISLLYREAGMAAIRRAVSFDKATGKIVYGGEKIRIKASDFFGALKVIVPTAMRGVGNHSSDILWNGVVGLDDVKKKLTKIHEAVEHLIQQDEISSRPSMASVVMLGKKGTGRHTLARAFAKEFGYETMTLDFLELDTYPTEEAYLKIDSALSKCRQIAPSVMIVENSELSDNRKAWYNRIFNGIDRMPARLNFVMFALVESSDYAESMLEYKKFGRLLDLNLTDSEIKKVIKRLGFDESDFVEGQTLGQQISRIRELKALKEI